LRELNRRKMNASNKCEEYEGILSLMKKVLQVLREQEQVLQVLREQE